MPGVFAQDVTTWAEMKQVLRQLKKPEVREKFTTVCIDTADVASVLCDKYVCAQNDVDTISQIPYGQGWGLLKKEFEGVFREITQLGYAVFFISHSKEGTFKRQDGTEYTQIRPSVASTYNSIIENMADLYGYMHPVIENGQSKIKISLRSLDGSIAAGGRFKYISPEIDSSYEALTKALNDAIDKEAELTNNKYVTNEKNNVPIVQKLDFDELMKKFKEMIQTIAEAHTDEEFNEKYAPRITQITNQYLGKGKKVSDCTRDQVEMLSLIVSDLEELL